MDREFKEIREKEISKESDSFIRITCNGGEVVVNSPRKEDSIKDLKVVADELADKYLKPYKPDNVG